MLSLIIKDILIQKKTLIFVFAYCVFSIFAFQSLKEAGVVTAGTAATYILLLTAAAYEDKNKSEVILNSLPTRRRDIVLAKYLSIVVFTACSLLFYWIASMLVKLVRIPIPTYSITLIAAAGILFVVSFMASIYLPLFFRFGYIKAKLFNLFIFLFMFFVPTYLAEFAMKNQNHPLVSAVTDFFQNKTEFQVGLSLLPIPVLLMLISYLISVTAYQRREF